jgi:tartrate-resistant acid phosphatase type 5
LYTDNSTYLAQNHDWHTVANTTAELAYAVAKGRKTTRWNMPSYYYVHSETFMTSSGASVSVDWVFIDTVILCGLSAPHAPGEHAGQPVPHDEADYSNRTTPLPPAAAHWAWLKTTLESSNADWLIVAGHYPVYSIAEHGSTDCLVQQLKPMLVAHNVALYINGHDHNLQWIDDGSGVGYVDCGPGHDYDTSREHASTVPPGASKYFVAPENGGFCAITLHDSRTATIDFHLGDSGAPLNYTVASWPNARRS